jgi:dTDP-4-dehydrorhamnose 3,5-epimerase
MPLEFDTSYFDGDVVVVVPKVIGDGRGFFMETYREDNFRELGLPTLFVQDNHSRSARGVVRGLHFQWSPPMGKLMRVTQGAAYLVAVDIRKGSPTFAQWLGLEITSANKKQVWAPYGFARGFCALTDDCEVQYKCTALYDKSGESGVRFDDPDIGVEWPLANVSVSDKDRNAQTLREWMRSPLSDNVCYELQLLWRVK